MVSVVNCIVLMLLLCGLEHLCLSELNPRAIHTHTLTIQKSYLYKKKLISFFVFVFAIDSSLRFIPLQFDSNN